MAFDAELTTADELIDVVGEETDSSSPSRRLSFARMLQPTGLDPRPTDLSNCRPITSEIHRIDKDAREVFEAGDAIVFSTEFSRTTSPVPENIRHVCTDENVLKKASICSVQKLDPPTSSAVLSPPYSLDSWKHQTSPAEFAKAHLSENPSEGKSSAGHRSRGSARDHLLQLPSQSSQPPISRPILGSTNFLIEEILKPTFGSASRANESEELLGRKSECQARSETAIRIISTKQQAYGCRDDEMSFCKSRISSEAIKYTSIDSVFYNDRTQTIKRKPSHLNSDCSNETAFFSEGVNANRDRKALRTEGQMSSRNLEVVTQNILSASEKSRPTFCCKEFLVGEAAVCASAANPFVASKDEVFSSSRSTNCSSQTSDDFEVSNGSSSSTRDSSTSLPKCHQLPAWVYCTRYSDRPSSGPRSRKARGRRRATAETETEAAAASAIDDKRPRTAFTSDQIQTLKMEFNSNQYLNEDRRHALANRLNLNETQIKIWFQNKRAKLKKASGVRNRLAIELMAQGLYNHSVSPTCSSAGTCAS